MKLDDDLTARLEEVLRSAALPDEWTAAPAHVEAKIGSLAARLAEVAQNYFEVTDDYKRVEAERDEARRELESQRRVHYALYEDLTDQLHKARRERDEIRDERNRAVGFCQSEYADRVRERDEAVRLLKKYGSHTVACELVRPGLELYSGRPMSAAQIAQLKCSCGYDDDARAFLAHHKEADKQP